MKKTLSWALLLVMGAICFGCSSDPATTNSTAGTGAAGVGTAGVGAAGVGAAGAGTAGVGAAGVDSAGVGTAGVGSAGTAAAGTGAAGTDAAGTGAMDAGADASTGDETALTGTLGDLGAVMPTVSSIVIQNSGETLIYLSSAPITCDTVLQNPWLSTVAMGSQIVEIVVPSAKATPGTVGVGFLNGGGEVNYAQGGRSSSYEESAASGSITFTSCMPMGDCDGTITATYSNPTGDVMGSFHATFCPGGQGY
jgi:hypothetical protein